MIGRAEAAETRPLFKGLNLEKNLDLEEVSLKIRRSMIGYYEGSGWARWTSYRRCQLDFRGTDG